MVVLALVLLGAGALVWVRPSGTSGDSFDANGKLLEAMIIENKRVTSQLVKCESAPKLAAAKPSDQDGCQKLYTDNAKLVMENQQLLLENTELRVSLKTASAAAALPALDASSALATENAELKRALQEARAEAEAASSKLARRVPETTSPDRSQEVDRLQRELREAKEALDAARRVDPSKDLQQENQDLKAALQRATETGKAAPTQAAGSDLQAENTRLQEALKKATEALQAADAALKAARRQKSTSTGAATGARSVAVAPSGSAGGVYTCAGRPLEFVRYQKDKDGKPLSCPFNAENYENWTQMPPLCDYLSLECLGKGNYRSAHIFGFGGPGLMIGQADVLMWEFAMARNPYIKNFVELGTVSGAGSLYFGVAARTRGGTLHTFDKADQRGAGMKRAWQDNMYFHLHNVLGAHTVDNPSPEVVKVLDVNEPVFAVFDNGDKVKEVRMYARFLPPGSVLLVHDWRLLDLPKPHWEVGPNDVLPELTARGLEPKYGDFAEHIGSSIRVFERAPTELIWEKA